MREGQAEHQPSPVPGPDDQASQGLTQEDADEMKEGQAEPQPRPVPGPDDQPGSQDDQAGQGLTQEDADEMREGQAEQVPPKLTKDDTMPQAEPQPRPAVPLADQKDDQAGQINNLQTLQPLTKLRVSCRSVHSK